jgi:hypothetical protein
MSKKFWGWVIGVAIFLCVLSSLDVDWSQIDPFATQLWVFGFSVAVVVVCIFFFRKLINTWERGVFLMLAFFLGITLFPRALRSLGYEVPGMSLLPGLLYIPGIDLPEGRWIFVAIYAAVLVAAIIAIGATKGLARVGLVLLAVAFGIILAPTVLDSLHRHIPSMGLLYTNNQPAVSHNCPGEPESITVGAKPIVINPGGRCIVHSKVLSGRIEAIDKNGRVWVYGPEGGGNREDFWTESVRSATGGSVQFNYKLTAS